MFHMLHFSLDLIASSYMKMTAQMAELKFDSFMDVSEATIKIETDSEKNTTESMVKVKQIQMAHF